MTNPVDSKGNVAVDFVWGNFPLQPDDVRQTSPSQTTTVGGDQNVGWTYVSTKPSAKLAENNISVTLNQLTQTVAPDNHIIAYQDWDSYPATDGKVSTTVTAPAWSPIGYSIGSGIPTSVTSITVPNLVGMTVKGAVEAAHLAGMDVTLPLTYTTSGATLLNHGTVVSQSPAAAASGHTQGDFVTLTVYKYQDASTPGIAGSSGYVAG
jgi:PASTA domain